MEFEMKSAFSGPWTRGALFSIILMISFSLLPQNALSRPPIPDIADFPQDLKYYLDPSAADKEAILPADLEEMDRKFNQAFFRPWHRPDGEKAKEQARLRIGKYLRSPGYDPQGKKYTRESIQKLSANANLAAFPNSGIRTITVAGSNLRELPTLRPRFSSRSSARAKNFDSYQYSAVAANTPLFVMHISKDRKWVLADTHDGAGWIPAEDAAAVDRAFMKVWEESRLVAVIKEDIPLADEEGKPLLKAFIGCLFPKSSEDGESYHIRIAVSGKDGEAKIKTAKISKADAVEKPLRAAPANFARLADALIGKSYGWGGMGNKRDCSSTLKDLFIPFGIWLPRDSGDQAKNGRFISLKSLSAEEKERKILREGIPFLTLISGKGHVMLYIGSREGTPLLLHNSWAAVPMDRRGKVTKQIIAGTIITSIYYGAESKEKSAYPANLINRIEGMTLLR